MERDIVTKRDWEAIEEIIDYLSVNGETSFKWRGEEYAIQVYHHELVFYKVSKELNAVCDLCALPLGERSAVGVDLARQMLNEKVLDGKSFIERWNELTYD